MHNSIVEMLKKGELLSEKDSCHLQLQAHLKAVLDTLDWVTEQAKSGSVSKGALVKTVDSDEEGHFKISNLPEGKYLLIASVSCLSWNWRGRSSFKITERTHGKTAKALQRRREGCHSETALVGQSADFRSV
jgi:hypothetical protein